MPRRIRVLQVIDYLGPGGAEVLLLTLAGALDRSRFQMYACGLREQSQFDYPDILRSLGVPVLELHQRNSYDIPALLGIVRYVIENRIDIIHTHLLGSDVMGRLAGFITRRPVVSTIHNSRTDLDLEPKHRQWLERWTARLMCRRLIIVSGVLREETAHWFGVPPRKVVSVTNGVNTERFHRGEDFDRRAVKQELIGGDFAMVLNVARLTPQKGQLHLLEAARIVIDSRPDVRLVFLGYGDELEALRARTAELGLTGNVIFAGYRPDVSDILAACDVFVLSSLWEGLPVALLEAMAAGCPSVVTNVGGVPEVLRDGVTGLLVPPAEPAALAQAILRLLGNPDYARKLGCAAQKWVDSHLSQRAWAARLERLYAHELRRRP